MTNRPPSDLPQLGEKETRDWHPDEQPSPERPELTWDADHCDLLQNYIWRIKDLLGLQTWDIFLTKAAAESTTNASVHPVYGRQVVALSVNENWWSYSPEEQRNTIVHEILHVIHNRQTEVIRTTAQTAAVWTTFERETELMVDHIATMIDVHFPLPAQPLFNEVMADLDASR